MRLGARPRTFGRERLQNSCRQTVSPHATRIRKFTLKEEPFLLMSRGNSSISQSNIGPHRFHSSAHEVRGRKWTAATLGKWFTQSRGGEACAARKPERALNRRSASVVCLRLFTRDSWWYLAPASNSHAAPTLPKKRFLGEHMERQGRWGGRA